MGKIRKLPLKNFKIKILFGITEMAILFAPAILIAPTVCGHLVRYPWSAISDWAWYRNFQYRTERAESNIISDIGIKFYPISDIPIQKNSYSSLVIYIGGHWHRPQYRRYPTSTSVIPISEENMSYWKLSFRYRKGSDIDIWIHSDIRYPKNIYHISRIRTQDTCFLSHCADLWIFGCRISDKSLFRYLI